MIGSVVSSVRSSSCLETGSNKSNQAKVNSCILITKLLTHVFKISVGDSSCWSYITKPLSKLWYLDYQSKHVLSKITKLNLCNCLYSGWLFFSEKNGSQILVPMTMISISPNGHDSWLQVGSKLLDRWCCRGWLVKIFLVTKTLPETDWKRTCIEMFLPKGLDFATYQLPQKKTLFPKRKCVYFPTYWCSGGRKNVALSGRRCVFLWQKSGCLKLRNNRMKRASETQVR